SFVVALGPRAWGHELRIAEDRLVIVRSFAPKEHIHYARTDAIELEQSMIGQRTRWAVVAVIAGSPQVIAASARLDEKGRAQMALVVDAAETARKKYLEHLRPGLPHAR